MIKRLAYRILASLLALLLIATQVAANDWLINSYRLGGAAPTPSLSFITNSAQNNPALAAVTFSTISTGTAGSNRTTIIAACGTDSASNFSATGLTVDGNAATKVAESNALVSRAYCSVWAIANASGTSSTIVVTYSEQLTGLASISVWAAYDLTSIYPATFASAFGTSGAALTLSANTQVNDLAVGACTSPTGSGTNTWTGLTERVDSVASGAFYTSADATIASASTPLSITCDPSSNTDDDAGVVAVFGPPRFGVTFVYCQPINTTALTTYTFTAHPTGSPDANRVTVVGIVADDTASAYTISSATINGISATVVLNGSTTLNGHALLFYAANPNDPTADIVVTWSEPISVARVCTWQVITGSSATPSASAQQFGNPSSTVSVNIAANGVALGICRAGSSATTTWSGLTKKYEDNSNATVASAADFTEGSSAESPRTITCTCSSGQCPAATAAWAP